MNCVAGRGAYRSSIEHPGLELSLAVLAFSVIACTGSHQKPQDQKIAAILPSQSAQLGGEGVQSPLAIAASDQTVVVAGAFEKQFQYGEQAYESVGLLDGFVLALSPAGETRFARQLGGVGDDEIRDLAIEPSGNILIAGHSTMSAALGDVALDARPEWTATLAELSATGETRWAVTATGTGVQDSRAVAVGPDGSIYCAGDFTQTLGFGTTLLTADGLADAYLAKFSSAGELQWLRAIGGAGSSLVHELHVNPDGTLVLAGSFQDSFSVDGVDGIPSPMIDQTPFVASFRDTGELVWLNSQLIFVHHDHAAYLAAHGGHAQHVSLGRVSVSNESGGALRVAVAYEELSGIGGEAVAHPAVSTLSVLELGADGSALSSAVFESQDSILQLGGLSAQSGQTVMGASWSGNFDMGSPQPAAGPSSLLISTLAEDGKLSAPRQFSVDNVRLTATDVAPQGKTLWAAAQWMDVASGDVDAVVFAFEP